MRNVSRFLDGRGDTSLYELSPHQRGSQSPQAYQCIEAVVGQLYLAVMIARLVSLYVIGSTNDKK